MQSRRSCKLNRRKPGQLGLEVLRAIIDYCYENNTDDCPSVREICMAIGLFSSKEVWWEMLKLEQLGIIEWPTDEARGRRAERGARLLLKLDRPCRVPIISDDVPGARAVEIFEDGRIMVDGKQYHIIIDGGPK